MSEHAFWIDHDDDRASANDGLPRYGYYVRHRADQITEMWGDENPADFAAFAWRTATGPIMAPGYVRHHKRIISAQVMRSGWTEASPRWWS